MNFSKTLFLFLEKNPEHLLLPINKQKKRICGSGKNDVFYMSLINYVGVRLNER
tara:strand:+ start:163 stop:324 length:162 start_codon:yes stop_codon:yes gene_type:complete